MAENKGVEDQQKNKKETRLYLSESIQKQLEESIEKLQGKETISNKNENKMINLQNRLHDLLIYQIIISILFIGFVIFSTIEIIYNIFIWKIIMLCIILILTIFLIWKFFSKDGLKTEIFKIFDEYFQLKINQETTFKNKLKDLEEIQKNMNIIVEYERESLKKEKKRLEKEAENNIFKEKMRILFSFWGINFSDDIFQDYIFKNSNNSLNFLSFAKFIEEKKILPKILLELLYNTYMGFTNHEIWDLFRKNETNLATLMDILRKSNKLSYYCDKVPPDVLKRILGTLKSFSISEFNFKIDFISKYTLDINNYYHFLEEEKIPFKKYQLWDDFLNWLNEFISPSEDITANFWDFYKNALELNEEWEPKEYIKDLLICLYLKRNMPESSEEINKKISNSIEISKILFFIIKKRSVEPLGEYIAKHLEEIKEIIKSSEVSPFFEAFHSQLKKGKIIEDDNLLFKIYRDESSFDLSYLNHLFFNPAMPIDFKYALNHYFEINASFESLIRGLNAEGKEKLFLMTFTSEGGIADALNFHKLAEKNKEFLDLAEKYKIQQYSKSARLGSLDENLPTLAKFGEELKIDLKKTIPYMHKVTELRERFKSFIEICGKEIADGKIFDQLGHKFNNYIDLKIDKMEIMKELEQLYIQASNNEDPEFKRKLDAGFEILRELINKYPPTFQILLHEIEYDPQKIKIFGEYKKIDPFDIIREMYAERTKDKEILFASVGFDEKKEHNCTIQEMNERLINSLDLFALVSKDINELQQNKIFKEVLDENALKYLISEIYPKCDNLLEFSFHLAESFGLDPKKMLALEDYNKQINEIIKKNEEYISKINKTLTQYLESIAEFSEELLVKISNNMIKSCICIAVVIFQKIIEAVEMLNNAEVKKIKDELLNNFDVDIIREKKFIIILNTLLSFYRTHKIRPLFTRTQKINEPDFHDEIFRYLYTIFGDDIIDESKVGGGRLDIYALKTPVEIKFEKKIYNATQIFEKYKAQFFDYCYKKGSNFGILCVYENTGKSVGYMEEDIKSFHENDYFCILIIFRSISEYSSKLKK